MLMSEIALAKINSFAYKAEQNDFEQPSARIVSLSIEQLQEILREAIQPLQDEISELKAIIEHQQEEIAALKAIETQDYKANSQDIREIFSALDEIDRKLSEQRDSTTKRAQPLQKDRSEILRGLLVTNGGKALAKDLRQKMRLGKNRFSELLKVCDFIEVKPLYSDKRKDVIVLKSKLVPRNLEPI